jgi:hypothetical protein
MNTINATARANGNLAFDLDILRGHGSRSAVKRQSRRQVRHRLAAELAAQMGRHLAEAMEMTVQTIAAGGRKAATAATAATATATIIAFPTREQGDAREVLVIRKSARSPFERKQVQVELLAA